MKQNSTSIGLESAAKTLEYTLGRCYYGRTLIMDWLKGESLKDIAKDAVKYVGFTGVVVATVFSTLEHFSTRSDFEGYQKGADEKIAELRLYADHQDNQLAGTIQAVQKQVVSSQEAMVAAVTKLDEKEERRAQAVQSTLNDIYYKLPRKDAKVSLSE